MLKSSLRCDEEEADGCDHRDGHHKRSATTVIVVVLIPSAAAVLFGRQAKMAGDRRGAFPLVIGVIAGIGLLALTIISEVGDILRR